ncbi:MAG: class I SAM-dependent methyltransferase [Desulfobacteraceae bacterium]|nr:MAG: class I SAM-dependent methyltransferase [Desulfobacteraceae bacterium]
MEGFSLNTELISNIFQHAKPLGHNERREDNNLGFGFLYYGVVRALRPKHVLVVGSGFGFSVVCLALALKDNNMGRLTFVDPSYDVLRDGPLKTLGGRGMWSGPDEVARHFRLFGVENLITHYRLSNRDFFPRYESLGLPNLEVAFIDGNHSYENVRYDFTQVLSRSGRNTYIFMHDTNIYVREALRNAGVRRWYSGIRKRKDLFECLNFPFSSGVAIIHVLEDDAWKHFQLQ